MENQKKSNCFMKLVCMFFISISIILVGISLYYSYQTNKIVSKFNETINERDDLIYKDIIDEIKEILEEQEKIAKQENKIDKTLTYDSNRTEYAEITSEFGKNDEVLYITSVEKVSNGYEIKGVEFKKYTLTDDEINRLKNGASIIIDGQEFKYLSEKNSEYLESSTGKNFYLNKINNVYEIRTGTEYPEVYKMTDNYLQITLTNDSKLYEGDYEMSTLTMKEFEDSFSYEEPKDESYQSGLYKLKFEGNKCVSIYRITHH